MVQRLVARVEQQHPYLPGSIRRKLVPSVRSASARI